MSDEPLDLGPIKARAEAVDSWVLTPVAGQHPDLTSLQLSTSDVPALIAEVEALREGMYAYTEHASRWKRERDEARAIITRAHHESIAGDGRSSVVLAVVRDILAEGVAE